MRDWKFSDSKAFVSLGSSLASVAYLRFLFVALLSIQTLIATDANSFEQFGKKLFGQTTHDELVADPLNYSVRFNVSGMREDESSLIENKSILLADQGRPVSGSLGLLTKAKSDRDNLVGALYEQARYGAVVTILIDGRNLDELPPTTEFGTNGPIPVSIEIAAGSQFRFGKTEINGDRGGLSLAEFGIEPGAIASSYLVIEAQDAIVRKLREEGHPLATVTDSMIEADHDLALLDVKIAYFAGPTASLGATTITGTEKVDAQFVGEQAMLENGSAYSPDQLAAAKKRLLDLGIFDSVTVSEGRQLDENGQLPIEIDVKERKFRYFGLGATYSNADGAGVESYWGHRNLFGKGEKLRLEASVNRIGEDDELSKLNFSTAILFEKPAAFGPNASFNANAIAVSENYDAFERKSVRASIGSTYKIDTKQELSVALDADWSRIIEGEAVSRHLILSVPMEYIYDDSDDRLDPTSGFRMSVLLDPAHDQEMGATFVKGKLTGSSYFTPSNSEFVTFAGKVGIGSILGSDLSLIPADRRFYAGGGGSIRGYAYQGVGPKDATGRPIGGKSIFESSLEARIQISEKLGLVPFVDAGNVYASTMPELADLQFGAGLGLRYKTPFGPLRLDVGIPLNPGPGDDSWAIYAGIGQSF